MGKWVKIVLSLVLMVFCVAGVRFNGSYLWQNPEQPTASTSTEAVEVGATEPLLGWQRIAGQTYYFDPEQGGAMTTGWLEYCGDRYYFAENGQMQTGMLAVDGRVYCLSESGVAMTGWVATTDGRRYFGVDGAMICGWLELDNGKYYLNENGVMMTGWVEDNSERYYLAEDGTMVTGWLDWGENRYYLSQQGNMETGWLELEEERYFFLDDGEMHTGWLEYEGAKYYLQSDGAMAVGEVKIDGNSRFFTSQGKNVILVNRWNPLPEDYEPELVSFQKSRVDKACQQALKQMLAACKNAGHVYYINASYRSIKTQQSIWDRRYQSYLNSGYSKEEANRLVGQSVAVPGTSEHHLGLAVDIDGTWETLDWLAEHCWEYGFIIRYPNGKTEYTGITYEPWHFRYVGVELAMELRQLNMCMEEYMQMLTRNE